MDVVYFPQSTNNVVIWKLQKMLTKIWPDIASSIPWKKAEFFRVSNEPRDRDFELKTPLVGAIYRKNGLAEGQYP